LTNYLYPAIFTIESNGSYFVKFPDIEGSYTQGDNLHDAYEMTKDVLCLRLYDLEESKEIIPTPSSPDSIKTEHSSFVTLISADTLESRRREKLNNKSLNSRKTINIVEKQEIQNS